MTSHYNKYYVPYNHHGCVKCGKMTKDTKGKMIITKRGERKEGRGRVILREWTCFKCIQVI